MKKILPDNNLQSTTNSPILKDPQVFIIGAGPGHPGLLTLRAVECLALADLVLYDKLVPNSLLEHARPGAELVCVSELSSSHKDRYLPIQETMLQAVHQGKRVARLKGGDPFIFGRGGEEVEFLRNNEVHYEIVPGVTSALGTAGCAGIPLTHRSYSSMLMLVTGHEMPDKPETAVDWPALGRFPGTIVIYMGLSRISFISQTLMEHGKTPDTPAAAIHWGSTGLQHTVEAPLAELPEKVLSAGFASPTLIFIGKVVGLRSQLSWFEKRPLFGKRILITRPKKQAAALAHRLELLGAVPFILPALDILPLDDWSEVDKSIGKIEDYHWLVFTSANGVAAFLDRLLFLGKDLRHLGSLKLAAIGPKTAEALQKYHLIADLVPKVFRSEELAEELAPLVKGQRVLLARANRGRDVLPQELAKVAQVEQIAVYNQVDGVDPDSPVVDNIRRGEVEFVTLTSPNVARAFLKTMDETCCHRFHSGEIKLVSISPVTSEVIRDMDFPVSAEATEFTSNGLVERIIRLVKEKD